MADRTPSSRHAARSRAAPYARGRPRDPPPIHQPKTPRTFLADLFTFITRPLGRLSRAAGLAGVEEDEFEALEANPAAERLYARGEEMEEEAAQASGQYEPEQRIPEQLAVPPRLSQQQPAMPPPPPPRNPPPSNLPPPPRRQQESSGEVPVDNPIDTVSAFLAEKRGRPLNEVEYAGVVSLLGQNVVHQDEEPREPFRFSTSPAPPAPGPSTAPPRPPRMLSQNPNGTYKWNGAASARPRRRQNRFASPGFGTPRSKPSIVLDLSPAEKPDTKGKRRRMDESAEKPANKATPTTNGTTTQTPLASTSASGSSSTPNGTAQSAAPLTNGTSAAPSTPPRARNMNKPVRPSPLRQAWRAEPPSPPTSMTSPSRYTRVAAATLSILSEPQAEGKKVKEEFVNPYDMGLKVKTERKPPARQRRTVQKTGEDAQEGKKGKQSANANAAASGSGSGSGSGKESEKDVAMSPQKIIEATVPKGAKRARPPPELANAAPAPEAQPALRRSARLKSPSPPASTSTSSFSWPTSFPGSSSQPTIVVDNADADESPKKRARTTRTVTVEEVSDEDMPALETAKPAFFPITAAKPAQSEPAAPKSPSPPGASFGGFGGTSTNGSGSSSNNSSGSAGAGSPAKPTFPGLKSSAPKAPSKLRYSFQAEKEESEGEIEVVEVARKDKGKGKGREAEREREQEREKEGEDEKMDTSGLDLLVSAAQSMPAAPRLAHAALPTASANPLDAPASAAPLPSFGASSPFFGGEKSTTSTTSTTTLTSTSAFAPMSVKKTTEEVKAAVLTLPVRELPVYDFGVPLSSPGAGPSSVSAKAQRVARGVAVGALPVYDFSVSTSATVKSDTASMSGKSDTAFAFGKSDTATAKSDTAPAKMGFDWAAAGMTKPAAPTGTWTCGECTLQSPEGAAKCVACDTPRPAGKTSASPFAAPANNSGTSPFSADNSATTTPVTGGFNWAAAGMKKPAAPVGTWTCGECTLQSPEDAAKCVACDTPRPASKASSTPATTGGFNWAAAGMAKPAAPVGTWTCGECTLQSPEGKAKCVACDAPRPKGGTSAPSSSSPFGAPASSPFGAPSSSPFGAPSSATFGAASSSPFGAASSSPFGAPSLSPSPFGAPAPTSNGTAPAPASGGFDWGAAGLKKPAAPAGTWACAVCTLQSPESAAKCIACETPRPGGAAPVSASSSTPSTSASPSASGAVNGATSASTSTGFNWAAAGLKKPESAGGAWTCGTCMVENPPSAGKCLCCEADR